MLAIITNKVLAACYFSKKDVMAISTFKKLNEAFTTLHSTISSMEEISITKKEKAITLNKNRIYVSEQEVGEKRNRVEEQGDEERGRLVKRKGPIEEFICLAIGN